VGGLARDPEVERWCAAELCARLKDAYPALNASRRMMFTVSDVHGAVVQRPFAGHRLNRAGDMLHGP
jgi:hypothetical protein